MTTEKDKSLAMTKKTTTSLADILAKEGLSALIPAGGLTYELFKTLYTHTRNWYEERKARRLEEFHEGLLEGIPVEHQADFLNSEFRVEDYYSLLNHVLQDEEDAKVEIYTKISRELQLSRIPESFRVHLIKSSRELKYSDFDLIRQLYINQKYEFKSPGNRINQIRSLTSTDDPIRASSIQTLIRLGFLSAASEGKPPWPTKLLNFTAELLYDEKDLTAESLGKTAKTSKTEMLKVLIACDDLDNKENGQILSRISDHLHQADIRNVIINPNRRSFPLLISPIIAICLTSKGSPFENIKKYANTDKKFLVQIFLPGAEKDNLPLKDSPAFDFTTWNDRELKKFEEFVKKQIG